MSELLSQRIVDAFPFQAEEVIADHSCDCPCHRDAPLAVGDRLGTVSRSIVRLAGNLDV
jgi:hypothetical protein